MMVEKAFPLGVARKVLEGNPNSLIIVEDNFNQVSEFLEMLGISRSRILVVGQPVKVRKLHMPHFSLCGFLSPENWQLTRAWLRERFPDVYNKPKAEQMDILVLDRNEGGCKRCIMNTGDIVNKIRESFPGRTVVHLTAGRMSVKQQMETFAKADFLIAPHGAGLTNIIFLPDHAKVIEVENHPGYFHWGYYEIALGLDLVYRAISPMKLSDTQVDFNRASPDHVVQTIRDLIQVQEQTKRGIKQ
jgi:capsular polysaccharide biosynthesis protein